ncbi:MAG: sulfite exporter TauE/SafE family protein [Euryarchaeota archaeon]|nr:sulfite exporter TauE/SafE family protein [Euryarchaeota archaeon]
MFGIPEVISTGDWRTILLFAFVLGLFTGAGRCLAICGPLFAPLATARAGSRRGGCTMALAFGAGRLLTYVLLGAMAGLSGGILLGDLQSPVFMNAAYGAVGGLGVALGIVQFSGRGFPGRKACARLGREGVAGAFIMGFGVGWVPCPPLMEFLALTMAEGKVLLGSLMLLVFGLGTALPLLPVGYVSGGLSQRLEVLQNRTVPERAAGLLLILFGLYLMLVPLRKL